MAPATRGTQRFCPECGAKVTKTQRFCRECGTDLQVAAEETVELATAAASTAPDVTTPLPTPPTSELPPPSAADPASVGAAPPAETAGPPWPAWLAAGACGVLVIATGLQWFGGGFGIDGLDIPLAILFSDSASDGFPIGVLFLVAAAVGLGMAIFYPRARPLSLTFMIVGGITTVLILWYMIRALTAVEGAPVFDVLSIGFWLALLASIGVVVGGIWLRLSDRQAS